jgi:hypothetical protein
VTCFEVACPNAVMAHSAIIAGSNNFEYFLIL